MPDAPALQPGVTCRPCSVSWSVWTAWTGQGTVWNRPSSARQTAACVRARRIAGRGREHASTRVNWERPRERYYRSSGAGDAGDGASVPPQRARTRSTEGAWGLAPTGSGQRGSLVSRWARRMASSTGPGRVRGLRCGQRERRRRPPGPAAGRHTTRERRSLAGVRRRHRSGGG